MYRIALGLKALFFRALQSIHTSLDLYFSSPTPQRAYFTRTISSTVSVVPGRFRILFYTPSSYKGPLPTKEHSNTASKRHPLLVNFHGGGFTIGNAGDDARWATAVTSQTSAVVASIGYRRAPEHPFPTGIEDCVSAILWLWKHADEFNLDISKTAISGFSAGGNLAYAVSIRLHEELLRLRENEGGYQQVKDGRLVSLVVFYGSTDWTQSRVERDASNPHLIPLIPATLFKLFDESYLHPKLDMHSPLLSPGLAPDELLRDAFPECLVLVNCEGDQLFAEIERFRARLVGLGKSVTGHVVEREGHAWDKKPTFGKGDFKRDEAYGIAVRSLQEVWV